MTLSSAITLGQSEPESNGNEGILCIHQSSSINVVSQSDYLMSQRTLVGGVLLCKDAVGVSYSPSRLGLTSDSMY